MTVIVSDSAVFTDGPCPLLTCLDTGPHGHDICPECKAVRFGNLFCRTCLTHQAANGSRTAAELLRRMEGGAS